MEMNRAVLVRRMAKAVLLPGPARAAHRARGRVHEFAVVLARTGVDQSLGVHFAGKIPGAEAAFDGGLRRRQIRGLTAQGA